MADEAVELTPLQRIAAARQRRSEADVAYDHAETDVQLERLRETEFAEPDARRRRFRTRPQTA